MTIACSNMSQEERSSMVGNFSPTTDGVDQALAVRIGDETRLDLNIYSAHTAQDMEGGPLSQSKHRAAVDERQTMTHRHIDRLENVIGAGAEA